MLIIADDITGAAEIAGIAWRKGLKVNLRLSGHKVAMLSGNEDLKTSKPQNLKTSITVIATDTRSGTEEEAVKTIEEVATCLYSGVQECRSVGVQTLPVQGVQEFRSSGVQTLPSSTSNSSTRQLVNLSTDASNLSTCQLVNSSTDIIFKKTDSVLRGHVAAELEALMRLTSKSNTLLIPQNPSKGRIVKDGIYYINGTPLDQTSFAYDPEFPAKTSKVAKLLGNEVASLQGHKVQDCNNLKTSKPQNLIPHPITSPKGEDGRGLLLPDATTLEEIREHVANADHNSLFAGGADMFEAVVDYLLGVHPTHQPINPSTRQPVIPSTHQLILCGSTQSRSLINEPFFADKNAIEVTMPEDVFHGTASIHETNAWIATLKDHWQSHDAMIVRIGHEATGGKEYAVRLRKLFGEMAYQILSPNQEVQTLPSSTNNSSTCQLVNSSTCEALNSSTCQLAKHSTRQLVNLSTCEALNSSTDIIIEGGATAYTVLERLGISSFDVEYEYSPGVVCLSHGNMRIILKPGSYPWGNLFEEL